MKYWLPVNGKAEERDFIQVGQWFLLEEQVTANRGWIDRFKVNDPSHPIFETKEACLAYIKKDLERSVEYYKARLAEAQKTLDDTLLSLQNG